MSAGVYSIPNKTRFMLCCFWLFVCWLSVIPIEQISLIWRRHRCLKRRRKLGGTIGLWAGGGGSLSCQPCGVTIPRFLRSNPKDCPNLVVFHDKQGSLRASSNRVSRGTLYMFCFKFVNLWWFSIYLYIYMWLIFFLYSIT